MKKFNYRKTVIFIFALFTLFLFTNACQKKQSNIEKILCKESNLWYVYSLDSTRSIYYPLWNRYTFYPNNLYKDRTPIIHCHVDEDGGKHQFENDFGKWHFYPYINFLQLDVFNIMKIKLIKNDTIVYTDAFSDDIFLLINVGEAYSRESPPKVKYSLPKDYLQ